MTEAATEAATAAATAAETAIKVATSAAATPSHGRRSSKLRDLTARATTTICRSDSRTSDF
jgi:hypothetical protein